MTFRVREARPRLGVIRSLVIVATSVVALFPTGENDSPTADASAIASYCTSLGATQSTDGAAFCVKVFNGSESWTRPSSVSSVTYLIVGGGGNGNAGSAGGGANGGSGGSVVSGSATLSGTTVTVTVGGATQASSLAWTGGTTVTAAAGTNGGGPSGAGVNGPANSITGASVIYGSSGGRGGSGLAGGAGAGRGGTDGPVGSCNGGLSATSNRGGGGGGGARCDYGSPIGWQGTVGGAGGSGVVILRWAAFGVSSFTTSATSPTNSASLTYTLTFTDTVDASTLLSNEFANSGNAANCVFTVSPTTGTAAVFTVTVSACSDGTVTPTLAAGSVVATGGTTGPAADSSGTTVTIDRTAPSAPGVPDLATASDTGRSSSDDVTSDTTPTFSVSGGSTGDVATISATNGSVTRSCTYTIGSATSCDVSPALTDGTWSVSGTLTDPAGNVSPAGSSTSFTLDTAPPSAPAAPDLVASSDTGASDADNLTNDTTPALSIPGANTGETVEFTATQGATTRTCSYVVGVASSCDISPALGDGAWSVAARVTDLAGNQSPVGAALSLTIDSTAPSAPGAPDLAAGSDTGSSSTDNLTSDITPTVSVTGGSAGDTVTVTATQGATTRTCSYVVGVAPSCDLPSLGDGTWTTSATLMDTAGNVSGAGPNLDIHIDSTAPVPSGGPDLAAGSDTGSSSTDNVTSDATPTLSVAGGSTGERVTLTATKNGTSLSCSYTVGVATSCDLPTLSDGTWSVSAAVTDTAGNTAAAGSPIQLTIDTTAPSPASVDLVGSSDLGTSAIDDLTSDSSPAVSVAGQTIGDQVTVTAQRGPTTVSCSYIVGTATSCDLPTLLDGTWSLTAAIIDAAGNSGTTVAPLSVTVDTAVPVAPGAPDLQTASDTGSSSSDDVTSDTTPAVSLAGGTAGDIATVTASDGSRTVSCTFVVGSATSCDLPVLADGTWQVRGTLTDPAGNISLPGPALPLVIDSTPPTIGPSPDLVATSDTGSSSTDNVTSDTTPTIEIPGVEDGATVTVTATKGSTTVTCSFVASATLRTCDLPGLTDGTWAVTAAAVDSLGNSASTPQQLSLRIDTTKPFGDPVGTSGGNSGGSTTTTTPRQPSKGTTTTSVPRRSTTNSPSTTLPKSTPRVIPSPFGTPDLRTESDTGEDRGDNLTSQTSPLVGLDGLADGDTVIVVATKDRLSVRCTYVVGEADGCRLDGLVDGVWTVAGSVRDLAGNQADAPGVLSLTIDTSVPAGVLSLSSAGEPTGGSMFIAVAGIDDGILVTISGSNGTDEVTCSFVMSAATKGCLLEGMNPGEWSVTGAAFDDAGNRSDAGRALDVVIPDPGTTEPTTTEPRTVPPDDIEPIDGGAAGRPVVPMSTNDTIALLASMLALLAISRRGTMGEPRRLDGDERQSTEIAGFSAGSGSGGLDPRSDLYVPPDIPRLDRTMCDKARAWSYLSPALGRSLDDGSYLRALGGVFWALLPLAGGVLGVAAALDTNSVAMLPALGVFAALLVIGTLDAFAGLVAVATYGFTLLVGGGLTSPDSLRGLLGIAAPMFLVGLVASAMRPYRRETGDHPVWNRTVDLVLIALTGAWAAGTMYSAIPHLSGYDVEWSDRVGTVELIALVTLVVRYGLENFARLVVADRLRAIENEELPEPGEGQEFVSKVVRTVVFVFVAHVFVGGNLWLASGAAMFIVPKILEPLAGRLPNLPTLYGFLPRGLLRIVMMLFVMLWWGSLVVGAVESNEIQWAFVLMSIPGIVLGVADWFAREGREWPSTVLSRALGTVVLVLGLALVRGWIL